MRKILWVLLAVSGATRLPAQSNAPARLAIIVQSPEAGAVADVLTVELSKNPQITLLERNEIDKVYREQSLSAANQDYLKLGQMLGADGLLLLKTIAAPTMMPIGGSRKSDLGVQVIAVRPGVLLLSGRISWPDSLSEWASDFATQLKPLLPKLSVLVQDAVPISIVNLRAPLQSPETKELECQLTALTIERLSRERQLFVLERRNMQLLVSEKDLNRLDDSAFWNGSCLLDGTLDREGYSKDKLTISARLIPPRGGTPMQIEVAGNPTNLSEIVNQLANKICENLKVTRNAGPWNTGDEAQEYFTEAKWALRWGLLDQAQSAAESAWALGKRDADCAMLRMEAYRLAIPDILSPGVQVYQNRKRANNVSVDETLDPANLDRTSHLLELYDAFSQTLPEPPKLNSPAYLLGFDVLDKATGVLRHFHFNPDSQKDIGEKLANLRALVRSLVTWISAASSVRDTYWLNGRIPSHDEIYQNFAEYRDSAYRKRQNFFDYELQWGGFWQEKPEDCVALYRELMNNPLFVCIHRNFWFRPIDDPRLTAWTAEDRKRVPRLWENFIAELEGSTNSFWAMEARAVELADAASERERIDSDFIHSELSRRHATGKEIQEYRILCDQKMERAGTNLFDFVINNYEPIVTNRDELLYLDWGLGGFFGGSGVVTEIKEKLAREFHNTFAPRLSALHDEYISRNSERLNEKENLPLFEKQKGFLANFSPYDFTAFNQLFSSQNGYSKAQAAELKSLLELYCSNLLATAGSAKSDRTGTFKAQADVNWIKLSLEKQLNNALNPPQPKNVSPAMATAQASPKAATINNTPAPKVEPPKNVLVATRFFAFPKEQLPASNFVASTVFAHRLRDDSLLLALQYKDEWWEYGTNISRQKTVFREAVAIWRTNHLWEIIPSRHTENFTSGSDFLEAVFGNPDSNPKLYVELFNNSLYISDRDAIREYDFNAHEWRELPFPGQTRAQLFGIKSHLYAASADTIEEFLDGGQGTRILASTRRRPAASALDTRDSLGTPVLFEGPDGSPYAALGGEVFARRGNDWNAVITITNSRPPEAFGTSALFRRAFQRQDEFWRFTTTESAAVLCWREENTRPGIIITGPRITPPQTPAPLWKSLAGISLAQAPAAMDGTTLYFFTAKPPRLGSRPDGALPEVDGRHADLICLLPDSPVPLTIPVKFDSARGPLPQILWQATTWMECSSEFLFIGQPTLPGVWAVPKSEIKAAIEKQMQQRQSSARESEGNTSL